MHIVLQFGPRLARGYRADFVIERWAINYANFDFPLNKGLFLQGMPGDNSKNIDHKYKTTLDVDAIV